MATTKTPNTNKKAGDLLLVRTRPGIERFCRGGLCFDPEGSTFAQGELSDEQLEALKAEPMLVLEVVTPKEQADD